RSRRPRTRQVKGIDRTAEAREIRGMNDLSRPWPLGLGTASWWKPVLVAVLLLVAAAFVDAPVSTWAQSWPQPIQQFMAAITTLGLSDWILIPSAILFVLTAGLAPFARWRLMRTVLW